MRKLDRVAVTMIIACAGAGGCAVDMGEETLDVTSEESALREVTDAKGNVWVLNRKIEGTTPDLDGRGRVKPFVPRSPDRDYSKMSDGELAEVLRPRMARDGHEYVLAQPDLELVRKIRAGQGVTSLPSGVSPAGEAPVEDLITPSVVIGADSRELRRDNASYPMLTQVWNDWGCSGTMVGPSTMVTAAHCVHDGNDWFRWPVYRPGTDIQDGAPYPLGEYGCYSVTIPGGWDGGTVSEDYAVVEFSGCGSYPGNASGWLGFYATDSGGNISNRTSYIYGYPGDKAPYPQIWGIGNTSLYTSIWYPARVFYTIDTFNGQSGSGVYQIRDGGGRYVVGIHNGSYSSSENQGRWLDVSVANFIRDYSAL